MCSSDLAAFFFTALVCHQALVARRPPPARLTEFYLCLSIGGVLGGGFNAFLAPLIFTNVWEYPLVLALGVLARPWEMATDKPWRWGLFATAVVAVAVRSEEHTSELQSRRNLVCRLLLEKKILLLSSHYLFIHLFFR